MEESVDKFDCSEEDEDEKRVHEPSVPLKCCKILNNFKLQVEKIKWFVMDSYQVK